MSFSATTPAPNLRGIAATVAVHIALLLVAATAFQIDEPVPAGTADAIQVTMRLAAEPATERQPAKRLPANGTETEPDQAKAAPTRTIVPDGAVLADEAAVRQTPAPPTRIAAMEPARGRLQTLTLPPPAQTTPPGPDPVAAYAAQLRQQIMAWKPAGSGQRGTVALSFTLDRQGALIQDHIAQSSGYARLDRTAQRMLHRAAPFDPPPAEITPDQLHFRITVDFH